MMTKPFRERSLVCGCEPKIPRNHLEMMRKKNGENREEKDEGGDREEGRERRERAMREREVRLPRKTRGRRRIQDKKKKWLLTVID